MPINFSPKYTITSEIATDLIRIESVKEKTENLSLTPFILASLRETARLYTTHYSTMIEGNHLEIEQVEQVIHHKGHFPGREREESEVKGYYQALEYIERHLAKQGLMKESLLQTIHALVMGGGASRPRPTPYREGQNVIRDGVSKKIVYMPPEAKDVAPLMGSLVQWMHKSLGIPCPILAGIAHYQFATIHPYYDRNGRTARLLTTFLLRQGGYGLKNLYSLEEYYAKDLLGYYDALSIGSSHNYYMGRAESDITKWISYFLKGMVFSFERVFEQMRSLQREGPQETEILLRTLDPKQRKVLELFVLFAVITARQIGELFGFQPRTSAALCKKWVTVGFLEMVDASNKGRSYRLATKYQKFLI